MKIKIAYINVTTKDGELLERFMVTEAELKNEASRVDLIDTLKSAVNKSSDTLSTGEDA